MDNEDNKIPSRRAKDILSVIINKYIAEGMPIGSKNLSMSDQIDLSPASIRNVMSDLENLGFIASPHTSAGRIPTSKGYRFFIDSLLQLQPVNDREVESIKEKVINKESNSRELAKNISLTLSTITQLAGIVTVPKQNVSRLKELDFIPLSENRILAILVINDSEVENRILQMKREYTRDELRFTSNYINQNYIGRSFNYIKNDLLKQLKRTKELANSLMNDIVNIAEEVSDESSSDEYILSGENKLLDFDKPSNIKELKSLFDAFNEKQEILHLLDKSMTTSNIQIFIGEESGYKMFNNCSLITSPYTTEDGAIGVLGVIGPTRIAYQKVIPIVDITAKILNQSLKS